MKDRFKLYCEYVHCCGKKVVDLGETQSEEQAEQWVLDQTAHRRRPCLPANDLIRTCPVTHCPAKIQFPRYAYHKAVL